MRQRLRHGRLRRRRAGLRQRRRTAETRRALRPGVGCSGTVVRDWGHDQRDQAGICAAADALQHHVADADGVSTRPCFSAHRAPRRGRPRQIAKTEQRTRRIAGADEHAVARKCRDRPADASTSRCSRSTSGMMRRECCRRRSECRGCHRENRAAKQPQVASMPGAAPNPCKRSSRIAPFAGNRPASRAICRRCGSAGPKIFSASAAALAAPNRRAPTGLAHRIRVPSVDHSHAGRAARRVYRQSRIAEALQLEFRMIHRNDMTVQSAIAHCDRQPGIGRRTMAALSGSLVSQARSGRSTAPPAGGIQSRG